MFARGVYQQHDIVRLVLGVWILDLHSSDKVLIDLKGPHYVKKKDSCSEQIQCFIF